jgi:hypothetical protein
MSAKNKLQEYCQKNKLNFPLYSSKSYGPAHKLKWTAEIKIIDLNIELKSTNQFDSKAKAEQSVAEAVLNILMKNNNAYIESKSNNSSSASVSSSKKIDTGARDDIMTGSITPISCAKIPAVIKLSQSNIFNESQIKNIVLIDLENKPSFKQTKKLHNLYIGFINSIHHSVSKYSDWYRCQTDCIANEIQIVQSNLLIYLIEGGVPNLVDHFMTSFVYPIVSYVKTNKSIDVIYIVSGDYAGFCTKICLERVFEWSKIDKLPIKNIASVDDIK